MKTSNHLLYAAGVSSAILGFAMYVQADLPVAQSTGLPPESLPCPAAPAPAPANDAGAGRSMAGGPAGR